MAGSPRGFETNVVEAAPGFGGQARFPRERRQSSAAAVVDALVIGPRRAEKIGRLLRERLMRRRVDATGLRTGARCMGGARFRRRRRWWWRTRFDCRRGDRWWCSRGCPRDGGRDRGCARRGWRWRGGGRDRDRREHNSGVAEWLPGHDRYRRYHDADRDDSEYAYSDRARPGGPGPAFPRRRICREPALVLVAHALDNLRVVRHV